MKIGIDDNGDWQAEYYEATVVSANDYYPFGSAMAGRKFNQGTYRFGFNGKEEDSEWGSQMIQDYGFRIYNPTIGKFLSVDPLAPDYPELTCYQFASNTPIMASDLDGLEMYLEVSDDGIGSDMSIEVERDINIDQTINFTYTLTHSIKHPISYEGGWSSALALNYEGGVISEDKTVEPGPYLYDIVVRIPIVYAHSINSVTYVSYTSKGNSMDEVLNPDNWVKNRTIASSFIEGLQNGLAEGATTGALSSILQSHQVIRARMRSFA